MPDKSQGLILRLTGSLLAISFTFLVACTNASHPIAESELATNSFVDTLNTRLQTFADTKVLPGFAVSIFTADSILFEKAFGFADLEKKTPYRTDHLQIIASATKPLVGVALMKAVEEGLLTLDQDINEILSYPIHHPNFPNQAITARMLATHTSSISDADDMDKGYRFTSPLNETLFPEAYHSILHRYNQTEEISMADFLERKLHVRGAWYNPQIFSAEPPGTSYEYSNIGIALLAHIIAIKSGQTFDQYSRELILEPLKMEQTTWDIHQIPTQKHINYYNELLHQVPKYRIITYPDGGLYSSVSEMRLFLQEMIKGYQANGSLLSSAAYAEMMRQQFEGDTLPDGLCWDLSFDRLIGHSGNDFGTATLMYFSKESGIGRILFTNISVETEVQEAVFYGAYNALFEPDFGH